MNTQRMQAYTEALKRFDWSFEFSDDHTVYCNGRDQLRKLHTEQAAIDPLGEVWLSVAPKGHGIPTPNVQPDLQATVRGDL